MPYDKHRTIETHSDCLHEAAQILRRTWRGDHAQLSVADTGVGIKKEDQEVIFEDFRQLDGSSSRQYGGTGVGLGLCRKLAAALGGKIRLSSQLGVGSVFSLLLPVKPPPLALPRTHASALLRALN